MALTFTLTHTHTHTYDANTHAQPTCKELTPLTMQGLGSSKIDKLFMYSMKLRRTTGLGVGNNAALARSRMLRGILDGLQPVLDLIDRRPARNPGFE